MKRCILMVGSTGTELPEVRAELAGLVPAWECLHTPNGLGAVDILTRRSCDALVADLHLGDLTGLQLLNQVMDQWPNIHRIILADLGDVDALIRCVGGAHQFLSRPIDAQRLKIVLERAFALDLWLPNQAARALLGRLPALPSRAPDYHAVVAALESGRLEEAARRMGNDPPLAAKVLQLANSAAYGPPLDEGDPVNAALELGLANVRRMILLAHTCSSFRELTEAGNGDQVEAFWHHARQTSRLAERIAQVEGATPEIIRQSATAGLLHDLGKLALAVNLPDRYAEAVTLARDRRIYLWEAEQAVLGADHGEVGGSLLGLWGLPMPVAEAVALYHRPTRFLSLSFNPLTAVHVANAIVRAPNLASARSRLDGMYLDELGLSHRVEEWWRCRETLQTPTTTS